jgi:hypothetical protein
MRDTHFESRIPLVMVASSKKKEKDTHPDYGIDLTEFDQNPELTAKYAAMSAAELDDWLKANRVVVPSKKVQKVARCVDGELWGAFPPCPRCHVGRLKVRYASLKAHGGQGDWTCRGGYDKSFNMLVQCHFTAKSGEVKRMSWRDLHDPAPSPRAPAEAAADDAAAELPSDFASFQFIKATATLIAIASKLGFQLPVESRNPVVLGHLNATKTAERTWDGAAALASLRKEFPPPTAEDKADGPFARCPENSALASCLYKLARLETQAHTEDFKISAYVSAAREIRSLDYAITSGKLAAEAGPTKVKGVGKGMGKKIDEFLETGTMSRIAELEAQTDAAA